MKKLILVACVLATNALADEGQILLKQDPRVGVVIANCIPCHSLDYIQMNSVFMDRKGWEATVAKMKNAFKAPIKTEDEPVIIEYLTQHYGKK